MRNPTSRLLTTCFVAAVVTASAPLARGENSPTEQQAAIRIAALNASTPVIARPTGPGDSSHARTTYRAFFGFLEFDWDTDAGVPGFGPLPNAAAVAMR